MDKMVTSVMAYFWLVRLLFIAVCLVNHRVSKEGENYG